MFLEETLKNNSVMNIDDLVCESYEHLLEYQNTLHELDMKMIKCEHSSIVNEDTEMIALAEEEYKSKVGAALKAIWNKIVIMVQNCIITINKMVNYCRQKFKVLTTPGFEKSIKTASQNRQNREEDIKKAQQDAKDDGNPIILFRIGEDIEVTMNMSPGVMMSLEILNKPDKFDGILNSSIQSLIDLKNNGFDKSKAKEIVSRLKDGGISEEEFSNYGKHRKTHIMLTTKNVLNVYDLLTIHSKRWIQALEKAKNEAKKEASMSSVIKDSDTAVNATYFQRTINTCIMFIQKLMSGCIKVLSKIKSVTYGYNRETDKIHYSKQTKKIENF